LLRKKKQNSSWSLFQLQLRLALLLVYHKFE
jgi:hypothetical protein